MTDLRQLHDSELMQRAAAGDQEATGVLELRTKAAAAIRLGLARTYGRGDMATFTFWATIPCLTPQNTLGVLVITRGTAWETDWSLDREQCEALGLEPIADSRANNPAAGAQVTHSAGCLSVDPTRHTEHRTEIPDGWLTIALPTWRGHEGVSPYRSTPPECFEPETWVRPRLVASGLTTCYGRPGDPEHGLVLTEVVGGGSGWPWGVPEWIKGDSVSVIDTIADFSPPGSPRFRRTRRPWGGREAELAIVKKAVVVAERVLKDTLWKASRAAREHAPNEFLSRRDAWKQADILEAALDLDPGRLQEAQAAATKLGNATNWSLRGVVAERMIRQRRVALDAIERGQPWTAAVALARGHYGAAIFEELVAPEAVG